MNIEFEELVMISNDFNPETNEITLEKKQLRKSTNIQKVAFWGANSSFLLVAN